MADKGLYRFEIRGELSPRITAELSPMTAERSLVVTVLTGHLDEAAAHGMIERIRQFGLDLMSVQRLGETGKIRNGSE